MVTDLRKIKWLVGDAKQEIKQAGTQKFEKIFVALDDLKTVREKHHLFIWGGRGCGKSALAWRLLRDAGSKAVRVPIDFEEAEPWVQSALTQIGTLASIQNFPTPSFTAEAWYRAILVEIMRQLVKRKAVPWFSGRDTLVRYIRKHHQDETEVFETLVKICQQVPTVLDKIGAVSIDPLLHSLVISVKGLHALEALLTRNTEFQQAEKIVMAVLKKEDVGGLAVVVDSVDKWLPPTLDPSAGQEFLILCGVVRGLTRALAKLYNNIGEKDNTIIKAMLPRDMKEYIEDRAARHERVYHHNMRWAARELGVFVARRMAQEGDHPKRATLSETWERVFPWQVTNDATKVKHDAFAYLLRHTQYRPREILLCCRLFSERARSLGEMTLSPKEFVRIIHQHSEETAEAIVQEYKLAYPHIYDALQKLNKSDPFLSLDDLHSRLHGVPLPPSANQISGLLHFLFQMGVVGVVLDEIAAHAWGRQLPYTTVERVIYYFAFRHHIPELPLSGVESFVIHPMFYGFLSTQVKGTNITVCQNEPL